MARTLKNVNCRRNLLRCNRNPRVVLCLLLMAILGAACTTPWGLGVEIRSGGFKPVDDMVYQTEVWSTYLLRETIAKYEKQGLRGEQAVQAAATELKRDIVERIFRRTYPVDTPTGKVVEDIKNSGGECLNTEFGARCFYEVLELTYVSIKGKKEYDFCEYHNFQFDIFGQDLIARPVIHYRYETDDECSHA